jgi:hypothetical protein
MQSSKLFFGQGTSNPIVSAVDLRDYLRDDLKYQYQDGFSMAEAAKCWVAAAGCVPPSIAALVGSDKLSSAHFEFPTLVWGRGTAMTDVMAFSPDCVIAVEAKVIEPFDDLVSVWIDRNAKNVRSPPHRKKTIERYAQAFGVAFDDLLHVRYQLLQRTLAAALTARSNGISQAWMIVQSFAAPDSDGHERNYADFRRFRKLVGDAPILGGQRVRLEWVDAY